MRAMVTSVVGEESPSEQVLCRWRSTGRSWISDGNMLASRSITPCWLVTQQYQPIMRSVNKNRQLRGSGCGVWGSRDYFCSERREKPATAGTDGRTVRCRGRSGGAFRPLFRGRGTTSEQEFHLCPAEASSHGYSCHLHDGAESVTEPFPGASGTAGEDSRCARNGNASQRRQGADQEAEVKTAKTGGAKTGSVSRGRA